MTKKLIVVTETTITKFLVDEEELNDIDLDDEEAVLGYVESALIDIPLSEVDNYEVIEREARVGDD